MTLLSCWLSILSGWSGVFAQQRTLIRAQRQALGALLCLGRSTLSRILWTTGREQSPWTAEYFLHSRVRWDPQQTFAPILQHSLRYCRGRFLPVAVDDTRLRKTGRCIVQAQYHRDPLSPPFHVNLVWALRFLQASVLLPLHRRGPFSCRAVPIRFEEVSTVKKPGRRASDEAWQAYRQERNKRNLSQRFVAMLAQLRESCDQAGAGGKTLLIAGDGSFCNRTVLAGLPARVELIARSRKDAKLCFRAPQGSRRFYGCDKFTPEQVRADERIAWQTTKIFYGGKRRTVRYKEVSAVLWQGGARRRRLRLLVIAPTPYRKRHSARLYYRQPAYLLTTVLPGSTRQLLQVYFDRWQIEVNHREEKDTLGVGQAQLWNAAAVPKQPVLVVAAYAALLLAALQAYGCERGDPYAALPKWRRSAKRPSCLDLITLLRKQVVEHPESVAQLGFQPACQQFVAAAAA